MTDDPAHEPFTKPGFGRVDRDSAPLVSVVMPAFNVARYIAEAVRSVLGQTYRPIELICVDDGSTDETASVLASFGDSIQTIHCAENVGIGAARNRGLAAARGAFVAFMDADDIWPLDKLQRQMALFDGDAAADLSFGHMKCFVSPELPDAVKAIRACPPDAIAGYVAATMLVRRDVFDRVGLFNPALRVGEFIDWFARAKEAGLSAQLDHAVFLMRRIHETNTGITQRDHYIDYVRVARQALKRRQAAERPDLG